MTPQNDFLAHYGVKGMKWGVRKDNYRSTSLRSFAARRRNKKVDQGFKKWKEGSENRENAISLGKEKNIRQLEYEKDKKNKQKKAQYKQANKEYKKALAKNTTYRKGTVREQVGKDLSRKYLSEAKNAQKTDNYKDYQKYMNKHDVERDKARRAQSVGQNRSRYKASAKRMMTMTVKAATTAAVISGGVYAFNKYSNVNINKEDIYKVSDIAKKLYNLSKYVY